jgi:arylsulfatase A-like enzyme
MAIRVGDWKLVRYDLNADGRKEKGKPVSTVRLYNLADDVGERKNLAAERPQKVEELQKKWAAWNATLMKPRWGAGAKK